MRMKMLQIMCSFLILLCIDSIWAAKDIAAEQVPVKGAPTDITGLTMEEIVGNIHQS